MRPGKRFGLSEIEKHDIWSCGKAGQSLHEIGRVFDKPHSSIRCLLLPRGGIPPLARRRSRARREVHFYRGYGIERLEELTRSRGLAGTISCVLFALANVPSWGWAPIIFAGFAGIVLSLLYLWRRNLWVNTHFVVDGVGTLMA